MMKPRSRREFLRIAGASALVVPRQAVTEKDGRKVVYRRRGWGSFAPVEVTIGATALGRVHVTAGLEEGDEIAVIDPTAVRATPTPGPVHHGGGVGMGLSIHAGVVIVADGTPLLPHDCAEFSLVTRAWELLDTPTPVIPKHWKRLAGTASICRCCGTEAE